MKNRRMIERMAEINLGQFDIDYYYNPNRFYPIGLGDKDIQKDLDLLKAEIDSRLNLATLDYMQGKLSAAEFRQIKIELENEYNTKRNELRNQYRRIDILILRQRVR